MKKIFFLLLVLPLFSFGEEEVTPFGAGRGAGADTAQPTEKYGHYVPDSTESRPTVEGFGDKTCPMCIPNDSPNLLSTETNFTPGQTPTALPVDESTKVKKGR